LFSFDVVDALITATIDDENIHLDCVYFLLRSQPDVLQNLLSLTAAAAAAVAVMEDENDEEQEVLLLGGDSR
jgi:hypothetical protein